MQEIPTMSSIAFTTENSGNKPWQTNYVNFKNLFHAVDDYYRKTLHKALPIGLPPVNCLELAKGGDREGLFALLTICFIACINSASK
jgi:hypothetical protein